MRKILEVLALSAALLLPFSGGIRARAEEIIETPQLEVTVNYGTENEQEILDYITSRTVFSRLSRNLYREFNIPYLDSFEEQQVENTLIDIDSQNINSNQDLLSASQDFSENQNLVLASGMGGWMRVVGYDINFLYNPAFSQDEFIYRLQNGLSLGTCGHIHTYLERFLNAHEIKSSVVSGVFKEGGHFYVISKIENGIAILDYNELLIINTKNIEQALEAYQKNNGTTAFSRRFYEDTEFKYRFITIDGKNFLDFIGYDETSEPLKNSLIQEFEPEPKVTITLNLEDYLTYSEANLLGFFIKVGEIRGDPNSALEKLILSQIGFKRKFLTPEINNKFLNFIIGNKILDINGNLINGGVFQDAGNTNLKNYGPNSDYIPDYNLIFATNNEEGFNFSFRYNHTHPTIELDPISGEEYGLFYDLGLGAGISYRIPIDNINIEPYIVSQLSYLKENLDNQTYRFFLSELNTGINFNLDADNSNFSIAPYYLWRIWEQGFGGEVKLETRDINRSIGINAEGEMTFSTYDFCPDKYNLSVGVDLNFGNLEARANVQTEGTNYDGERETQESVNLQLSLGL